VTEIRLTINGRAVSAEIEPRMHLADFLRERQALTGTHIGCEHGVCGACTLLLDGEPARSCITFAAACDGLSVQSIEGLENDPVMERLRLAFTAKHALQCGYCTPGMLVTARDIVIRLPDADDNQIRLELAGNLCRCTGYQGIVDAIRSVLDSRLDFQRPGPERPPSGHFATADEGDLVQTRSVSVKTTQDGDRLVQSLRLAAPLEAAWQAIMDPRLIANCVPGAHLNRVEGGRIEGEMMVSLGPIQGRFSGQADIKYDPDSHSGSVEGEGRDQASGTHLSAQAIFALRADGEKACIVDLATSYRLRGALAQFGRGPVVQVFAAEIAEIVGRNLEATLTGGKLAAAPARLGAGRLALRLVWRWMRTLLSGRK
jgi:carbon-monoxide dehydrogenase small subunit